MYDIVGDIHGRASLLENLLIKMGYTKQNGIYKHPSRKAIFVGDFINKGPEIKKTIQIVRSMVEAENALAILGNHEIYAILHSMRTRFGRRLSTKLSSYEISLEASLSEFYNRKSEWKSNIKWMQTLPMFLDLGDIRIVHAYWNDQNIEELKQHFIDGKIKKEKIKQMLSQRKELIKIFWETCKGPYFSMPKYLILLDKKENSRQQFRMKWWVDIEGQTFKSLSFDTRFDLPDYTIPSEIIPEFKKYPTNAPIVFFGHYCIGNKKNILKHNICCLDSCVRKTGKIIAYRWNGEKELKKSNLLY